MDHAPVVQVLLDGRVVAEVPFSGDVLRVGRMRNNDVVLPNLSVSRFHALLHRDGDGLRVEDLGSENGCLLNGSAVEGTAPFGPGDEIQIVRHVLRLRVDEEYPDAELPALRSDEGSAAQASLDTAPLRGTKPADPPAETVVDLAQAANGGEPAAPVAVDATPAGGGGAGEDAAGQGPLFDFSMEEDLGRSDPALGTRGAAQEAVAGDAPGAPLAPALHAGLIVQRDGRLERVLAWNGGQLCAGRSSSCEIPLGSPRVSRRHALFVRDGDRFEVRDLDSVGGVLVNGERVLSRVLAVGDVVRIDDFDLTFVLDPQPVGESLCTRDGADGAEVGDTGAPTQLGDAGVPAEEATMPPQALEVPPASDEPAAPFPELDLVEEAGPSGTADDEKELEVSVAAETSSAASVAVSAEPSSGCLVLEVELEGLDLPEPVRRWLEGQPGPLRMPVQLRLRRREPTDES